MTIKTIIPRGLDGRIISIEIDHSKSLPGIDIIGLPDSGVRESIHRLRAAFRKGDIGIPPVKYIINLAPSDVKKAGAGFDLPIATALLLYIYPEAIYFKEIIPTALFIGELGLHGDIKHIHGILSMVLAGKKQGFTHFFIPESAATQVATIPDITIYPCSCFSDIVGMFLEGKSILSQTTLHYSTSSDEKIVGPDMTHIKGHEQIKRALAIAASGFHNVLMIGPPGSGKSLLAKAMHSILPTLDYQESIEVSQIFSVGGLLENGLLVHRPFRSIHHTTTKISLIGGGAKLLPGEISYAHRGILFVDELPEFSRDVLDTLRQPIEDKYISISRLSGRIVYPADCMIVGAMNPCICGYYNDPHKTCTCSITSIKKYQSKISGPLLDRFDIVIHVPNQGDILQNNSSSEQSSTIKDSVGKAWFIQQERFKNTSISTNSSMSSKQVEEFLQLDKTIINIIEKAQKTLGLSHRAVYRILKVARSIADYEQCEQVDSKHILEAIQYRGKGLLMER